MVIWTALMDIRAGTAIITWLSRSLAIITTITVTSIVSVDTLGASVVIADSMTITWLSRPLAVISTIAITSIVSMQTLASVCVAHSMAVTISRLGISGPLAISVSNVVSVCVMGRVVSVSMISLGDIDRSSTISMAISISRFSLSRSLTISMVSIPTIVTMETLRTPVCVATASIRMVGNTSIAIARLSRYYCGKGCNYCYNLSCHG